MTAWRSSRLLPVTRTWSAWIEAWALIFESLIVFTIAFAFAVGIPCWILTAWRTVAPAAGSTFWKSRDFTAIPRLTSFVSRMSTTLFNLCSSSEERVSWSSFSFHSIFDLLPRKSKRVAISFEACWTAFNTSWRSTLETTSNELSWAMGILSDPAAIRPGSRLVFDDARARGRMDRERRRVERGFRPEALEPELRAVARGRLERQRRGRPVRRKRETDPGNFRPALLRGDEDRRSFGPLLEIQGVALAQVVGRLEEDQGKL